MKIKVDENLPAGVSEVLAAAGHDVHTVIGEGLAGQVDRVVFQAAVTENRLFVTQDLDFSDIRQFQPGVHAGIVLIRLRDPSRSRLVARMQQILADESIESWHGCFVVISYAKLRIRRP